MVPVGMCLKGDFGLYVAVLGSREACEIQSQLLLVAITKSYIGLCSFDWCQMTLYDLERMYVRLFSEFFAASVNLWSSLHRKEWKQTLV